MAALAMTAAVGASSASAEVLCSKPVFLWCGAENILPAGSPIGVGTYGRGLTIGNNWSKAECYGQIVAKSTTKSTANGVPLPATTENLLNNCVTVSPYKGVSCQTSSMSRPKASFEVGGSWGAGIIRLGSAAEPLTLSISCTGEGQTVSCIYKATEAVQLHMQTSGENAANKATIAETPMTASSGPGNTWACLSSATLTMNGILAGETPNYMAYS
jgi:hypothetical protein